MVRTIEGESHEDCDFACRRGYGDVDGEIFEATFIGQQTFGFGGCFVPVNNAQFICDLANKETLTISCGEGYLVIVGLDGADAASAALRACQEAQ